MRMVMLCLVTIVGLPLALSAQEAGPSGGGQAEFPDAGKIELYKDPLVAAYLSGTIPGLGQAYVGHGKRGLAFLAGVIGAFGSAYACYEPARLEMADYDLVTYGGNGDGVMNTNEVDNWQDNEYEDDAFGDLSTGRKVGTIAGVVVGAGLYIWNILDARNLAREHNRELAQRKVSLGALPDATRPGMALNLRF